MYEIFERCRYKCFRSTRRKTEDLVEYVREFSGWKGSQILK